MCPKKQLRLPKLVRLAQGFKHCSGCDEIKSRDSFNKESKAMLGLGAYCKKCIWWGSQVNKPNLKKRAAKYYKNVQKPLRQANQHELTEKMKRRRADPEKYARMRLLAQKRYHTNEKARDYAILHANMRKHGVEQATPAHADLEEIKAIYKKARELNAINPRSAHVDHIIPLNHPLVCGLHVAANLQILDQKTNLLKSNHFEV